MRLVGVWIAALLGFIVLATANSAGYRYGLSDQLFYLPSVLRALDPTLFPRDSILLDAQSTLILSDQLLASVVRITHASLPIVMLIGYVLTLALLLAAAMAFARPFLVSGWSIAVFGAALTLRHRIAETGVNTLEGYWHPRILAFAVGIAALAVAARKKRTGPFSVGSSPEKGPVPFFLLFPLVLVVAAGLIHPTTGLWFAVWLFVMLWINEPQLRRPLAVVGIVCIAGAMWALAAGPLARRLTPFDAAWEAAVAGKDYIFPTRWPPEVWALHAGCVLLVVLIWRIRLRRGLTHAAESGLVMGCLALVVIFLLSLPFIAARLAFAVQLQVSRVLWMVDFLATLYLVWWLAEGMRRSRPRLLFTAVLLASMARGLYILNIEFPDRRFAQVDLEPGPWLDAGLWLRTHTAGNAHLLADPDHAWKYGASVRLTAERDVLLEVVKDTAVALYARNVAVRVDERMIATRRFASFDETAFLRLARRYDLDYLIVDRKLELPAVYRNERFHVYDLRQVRNLTLIR
ncbi:MAG: hypothetical protein GEV06_12920 [Luteitalea sp.]|nr:hypothetical protein [Luteitalea sp.]